MRVLAHLVSSSSHDLFSDTANSLLFVFTAQNDWHAARDRCAPLCIFSDTKPWSSIRI